MNTPETVLIAGGSGLIGMQLSEMLTASGYQVRILTRARKQNIPFEQAEWNPETHFLEKGAFHGVKHLINLSGTGIADKRWTKKRKQQIVQSRIQPIQTLIHHLQQGNHQITTLISASAIGIYPKNMAQVMTEDHQPGSDFLSRSVFEWEQALIRKDLPVNIRTAVLRLGFVLSEKGGFLSEILKPLRFGLAVTLGNGKQMVSWVHIEDVCRAMIHVIQQAGLTGVYNVTAPMPLSFKELMDALVKIKNRRYLKITVPAFILQRILGERACLILDGMHVSSARFTATGFQFRFPAIAPALMHLLKR
jgi:hypothetical protein